MSTMPASVGPVALAKLTRSDIHHVLHPILQWDIREDPECRTDATFCRVSSEISQRELRNNSGEIMRPPLRWPGRGP